MNLYHNRIVTALILCSVAGCGHTNKISSKRLAAAPATSFCATNGAPSKALCELFTTIHLDCKPTITEMNKVAQANLLRKGERWETEKKWEAQRNELMPLLRELGVCDAVMPHATDYDYILVLGGLQSRVEKRIGYLEALAHANPALLGNNSSGRTPTVILLSSYRPLDPQQEPLAQTAPAHQKLTEADMMHTVMNNSTLGQQVWADLISTPMKTNADGTLLRPTTDDTVNAWLSTHPAPGRCLIISDQPFIERQTLVLQALLPKGFVIDAAGPEADRELPIAVYLDEVARTIYQLTKVRN